MASSRLFRQDDFSGGLNLRADQFQLAQNESPRMLNVEIDPRGGVFSRGAMRSINTAAVDPYWRPERLFPFYGTANYAMLSTGYSNVLGVVTNGNVFYSTGAEFSNLNIPVSSTHGASFAPWGSKLYMATGVGSVSYKWDGATKTALTASGPVWQNSYTSGLATNYMPKAEHTVTHAGKVFVANTFEDGVPYPNRVRWSHPNNPENWAAQDYIDINDGGSKITGITVFAGHLVVFKQNSVYAIFGYDSDTFQVVEVSRVVGAPTSHAFCVTERGVYFFSYPDGLMMYNGERVVDLFEPIRPAITTGQINPAGRFKVYVSSINRRIWVSLPYSDTGANPSEPTTAFVFDPSVSQRGAWLMFSTYDGFGGAGGCDFLTTTGDVRGLIMHPTKPYVLWVDQYSSAYDNVDGTENQFTSRYRTRWIDAGSYSNKKMFRRPDIIAKQTQLASTINVKAYGNYEEAAGSEIRQYSIALPASGSGMLWGSNNWGATWGSENVGSQIVAGRSIGLLKSVQLEFSGSPGANWGINSYTLKYNPRKVV